MRTSIDRALLVSSLTLVAACGGKVIFSEGTGGAGGGGVGGSGDVATSTAEVGTSSVSNGTTSGGQSLCQDFCTKFANCIGDPAECIQGCASSLGQGCDAPLEALVDCYDTALNPETCDYQGQCDQLENEFQSCLGGDPPPPSSCVIETEAYTMTSCKSAGTCFGSPITVSCDFTSNGETFCNCFSGDVAATCQQESPDCFLETSCCLGALFGG